MLRWCLIPAEHSSALRAGALRPSSGLANLGPAESSAAGCVTAALGCSKSHVWSLSARGQTAAPLLCDGWLSVQGREGVCKCLCVRREVLLLCPTKLKQLFCPSRSNSSIGC